MSTDLLEARPTLRAWLDEYAAIEADYLARLADWGIRIAPRDADADVVRAAKDRLREKGAQFRNGDAGVVCGNLSSACVACTGGRGSKTFFLSLACNRSCYFCFNANQADYADRLRVNNAWRDEVDAFADACGGEVTHVGLTGGEPLLHADESVAFCAYVRQRFPRAHIRLYTASDFLDEPLLDRLRDAGLDELRMSIKLDVLDVDRADEIIDDAVDVLARAKRFISQVMVEMPVIPGTGKAMRRLLDRLDQVGAFGINLLEFCYPMGAWDEFERRGFSVKNPPFPVLYDYGYAGGLPLAGSELLCLELLEYALDEGLSLSVHYCSLENKHRDQICVQNGACSVDAGVYERDPHDFFLKTVKVFDGDVSLARRALEACGVGAFSLEDEGLSLAFHPRHIPIVQALPVVLCRSINVLEETADGFIVRELKLEPLKGE